MITYLSLSTISPAYLRTTITNIENMELSNNFVIIETDQATHKCTAMLVNFLYHTQNIDVGQSITSEIFEMTCPKIGKSSWTLILFPAGQYEFERDNGQFSVYLKMIACEHENETMLADVIFFIDSEDKFRKVLQTNTFCYDNTRTRWVGTKLVSKSELHEQGNFGYLIRENNLVIGYRMILPALIDDEKLKCTVQSDSESIQVPPLVMDLKLSSAQSGKTFSSPSPIQSHVNGKENSSDDSTITFTKNLADTKRLKPAKKARNIFCWSF